MTELANIITEMVKSGNILWLSIIIIIVVAWKLPSILEFIENRKKIQLLRLIEASECEHLDENFKQFILSEIQREYFSYITNITSEKKYRDKIIEIHKNSNGEIPFYHFKRASGYLKYSDNNVTINITKFDTISSYFNSAISIVFGFIGIALFLSITFIKPISIIEILILLGMGFFFVVIAMYFALQTFPLYSAKFLKPKLNK